MILIDPPLWPARGRVWSHMVSDVSYEELHSFARGLGLPPRAFERDHYDVRPGSRVLHVCSPNFDVSVLEGAAWRGAGLADESLWTPRHGETREVRSDE